MAKKNAKSHEEKDGNGGELTKSNDHPLAEQSQICGPYKHGSLESAFVAIKRTRSHFVLVFSPIDANLALSR